MKISVGPPMTVTEFVAALRSERPARHEFSPEEREADNWGDIAQRRVMIQHLMKLWNCSEVEVLARARHENQALAASA